MYDENTCIRSGSDNRNPRWLGCRGRGFEHAQSWMVRGFWSLLETIGFGYWTGKNKWTKILVVWWTTLQSVLVRLFQENLDRLCHHDSQRPINTFAGKRTVSLLNASKNNSSGSRSSKLVVWMAFCSALSFVQWPCWKTQISSFSPLYQLYTSAEKLVTGFVGFRGRIEYEVVEDRGMPFVCPCHFMRAIEYHRFWRQSA